MRIDVSSLEYDSRRVSSDSVFFAIDGHELDGHQFIPQALSQGAAAIVSERPGTGWFSGRLAGSSKSSPLHGPDGESLLRLPVPMN